MFLGTKDGTGNKQHKKLFSPCRAGSNCQGSGHNGTILDIFESMWLKINNVPKRKRDNVTLLFYQINSNEVLPNVSWATNQCIFCLDKLVSPKDGEFIIVIHYMESNQSSKLSTIE